MRYIADLHIHSPYSRATSKELNLEHLHRWGMLKGLTVIATGDVTHPARLQEIRSKLIEAEEGLFRLRPEWEQAAGDVPPSCRAPVRFILSGEISTIYKKNGRVRKVHSVIYLPTLEAAEALQRKLERIGNLAADGRPILGFDTRDLLELLLETHPQAVLVPAHIWTPWFSLFGSKSGFDRIEECFGDLTPHIFALETGLSSDPPMNWRLSQLDNYTLISNSDAHSPDKLGREANIFDAELSYPALFAALRDKQSSAFGGTVEFFPEEGKYHADGHRKCGVCMMPEETKAHRGICPVCGSPLVLGVSYRVEELADRPYGFRPPTAKPFHSLIPLPEVLSQVFASGIASRRVEESRRRLLHELGPEMRILLELSLADIRAAAGDLTTEAIRRMREGRVRPQPGYDGEYGVIRIFDDDERHEIIRQKLLFNLPAAEKPEKTAAEAAASTKPIPQPAETVAEPQAPYAEDEEQKRAIAHRGSPLIIIAGPGSGKTYTLTRRIASLIEKGDARPEEVLAVTFTNRAADEMRQRLAAMLGEQSAQMTVSTLHAFGASLLREQENPFFGRTRDFVVVDGRRSPILQLAPELLQAGESFFRTVSLLKCRGFSWETVPKEIVEREGEAFVERFRLYETLLEEQNAVDLEDLILLPLRLLRLNPDLRRLWLRRHPVIAVDEFQDLNLVQYELIRLFGLAARDFCVIGDPDQAIYGFRGSEPRIFERIRKDFPHAALIRLRRNYRSTSVIMDAARQMLQKDDEPLHAVTAGGAKVTLHAAAGERAEADFVVRKIEELLGGTGFFSFDSERVDRSDGRLTPGDIAVLLRSRALAPPLIEAFEQSGIPYEYADDAFLLEEPLFELLTAAWKAVQSGRREDAEAAAALLPPSAQPEFLAAYGKSERPSLIELLRLLKRLLPSEGEGAPQGRILQRLIETARFFEDKPERFFDISALQRRSDHLDPRGERVRLLTLHAAKGLQFPAVFIVGCEEGILPHHRAAAGDVDEERRLFYVGMTRAEHHLFLSRAKTRTVNGRRQEQAPSRFLEAVSESLLLRDRPTTKPRVQQMSLF